MKPGMVLRLFVFILTLTTLPATAFAAEESVLLPTLWEPYKWLPVAVLSLCVLQTALILLLLASRKKRRRAEMEKNALAAIVESSDDAISSNNLEGTITSWNAGAAKLFGYPASEMLGKNAATLAAAGRTKEVPEILERIRGGNVDYLETVRSTKDGREIDVALTVSPIRGEDGTITGASTIAREITARKKAEQKLRESEERFRMIADTTPVMIWVSGTDALCTFFNRQWLEFTGRTLEQELGMGWTEGVHPEDSPRCLDLYRTAFSSRKTFSMEYRFLRSDGQYRWIANNGVPRLMPNGDLAGYIGSCLDITERKQDELIRQHLTSRLLMMQDEERRRVAGELHDGLGQSLSIIRNRAMISMRENIPAEIIRDQLREISETAAAAMIEVRQIAHNLRPFELDRLGLIAAIESMIQRVSESTSIALSADLEHIDGLLSQEAETSVYRIVQESLNNVIKHSQATAARVEIRKNGNVLAVSMMDNGIGISSHGSNGHKSGGTGLAGIAERVRGLGGSFQIDSQPNQGTRLTVQLEPTAVSIEGAPALSYRRISNCGS